MSHNHFWHAVMHALGHASTHAREHGDTKKADGLALLTFGSLFLPVAPILGLPLMIWGGSKLKK